MQILSIVIPAYNEAESIAALIRRVDGAAEELLRNDSQISDVEILVVNDGSTDQTAEKARASPKVRVINHQKNQGYGGALKTGFLNSRGDLIAFLDADGTYPPEYLKTLCEPVIEGKADMVVGTRDRGKQSGMPFIRRVGNWLFARLLGWITETPVSDSASGMRVFRKSILPRLLPLPDGLDFIAGMSTRALHEDLRVIEIPIPYAKRQGRSKLSFVRDGFRFLRTFIFVAATYNPLKFFGLIGLLLLVLAFYLGISPIIYYLQHQRVEDWEIYRLFTILVLGILSLQLINFGIISNRLLAIVSGLPVETRSLFGRLFLNRSFSGLSWKIGAALCMGAVVINYRTIAQYLTLQSIYVHWSYIITGGTMFLVGAQLLMSGALFAIFRKVEERQAYLKTLETKGKVVDIVGKTTEETSEGAIEKP